MNEKRVKILDMLKEGTITTDEAMALLDALSREQEQDKTRDEAEHKEAEHQEAEHQEAEHQEGSEVVRSEVTDDVDTSSKADASEGSDMDDYTVESSDNDSYTQEDSSSENNDSSDNYSHTSHQYYSWANDLKNNIIESAKGLTNYISEQTYPPFGFRGTTQTSKMESREIESNIQILNLAGKNHRVEVVGYEGNTIKVIADYKVKGSMNPRIHFEESEGNYAVSYDYNAVYSMALHVQIPHMALNNLHVENVNGEIILNDILAERFDVVTKNAPIYLKALQGQKIIAETKNGHIKLDDIHMGEIRLKSSNFNIALNNVEADFARIQTSNGPIAINAIDIRQIEAVSSNAGISFSNSCAIPETEYDLYSIDIKTSNGPITIEIPALSQVSSRLRASTSGGGIYVDMPNMQYFTNSSNYIDAKTSGYEMAVKKLNLNLQTSNGTIHVR